MLMVMTIEIDIKIPWNFISTEIILIKSGTEGKGPSQKGLEVDLIEYSIGKNSLTVWFN